MKSVHKALQLRNHKHTGKLLPHKHTSYGVLFLLMLVPIAMMALVGHLASANDLVVTAKVPAPMPDNAPVITRPTDGSKVESDSVRVSGTCPVINPAVIIVIYAEEAIVGSTSCSADGTFDVRIPVGIGSQKIIAQVVTITDDIGPSSKAVTIFRITSASSVAQPTRREVEAGSYDLLHTLQPLVRIVTDYRFVPIEADGNAQWKGSFIGGVTPYGVTVDWGDGTANSYVVTDQDERTFSHHYGSVRSHNIVITVTDANGMIATVHSVAMSMYMPKNIAIDRHVGQMPAPLSIIQKYLWHIYILTLSGIVFLWYLEHGRHLHQSFIVHGHGHQHMHRRRKL